MSNRYGITLDPAWTEWAAKEKASETVAAALYLICETRPLQEVVAKLTPPEFERITDVVRRWPEYFPTGTLAALKGLNGIPSPQPPADSVSADRALPQRPVGTNPDIARERHCFEIMTAPARGGRHIQGSGIQIGR